MGPGTTSAHLIYAVYYPDFVYEYLVVPAHYIENDLQINAQITPWPLPSKWYWHSVEYT